VGIRQRILRHPSRGDSLSTTVAGSKPLGRAARMRLAFIERAPRRAIQAVAAALARGRPPGPQPGWRFRFPEDDESELTLLRWDIWRYFADNGIETPLTFRWYDRLRLRVYLGNDLSLSLYVFRAFEPNEFVFLRRVLEPGMVVLDGGANEGLYSLYAARRVGPRGAVLAVEPSTREFSRLLANIELNRLRNVEGMRVALGSRGGDARLAVAQTQHSGMNALDPQASGQSPAPWTESHETVRVETIDEIVAQRGLQRLDLVKLDIEGSEADALAGARAAISCFRPIILLEVEEARLASQGRTRNELVRALGELGYDLWVFDDHSAQLRPAELPAEPDGNAIAAPRGWRPPDLARPRAGSRASGAASPRLST
jgi:FkbM family methyltransferase